MKKILRLLLIPCSSFLTSCVMLYTSPVHNTPCFTDKKQFEGAASAGITGMDANLAYSPFKYASVQVSGHSSLSFFGLDYTGSPAMPFNDEIEVGLGGYLPVDNFLFGANAGYGVGGTRWNQWLFENETAETFRHAQFNTTKAYIGLHMAYLTIEEGYIGFSGKVNIMRNAYSTIIPNVTFAPEHNVTLTQTTSEYSFFYRKKADEWVFYTFSMGVQTLPASPHFFDFRPFASMGILFKLK